MEIDRERIRDVWLRNLATAIARFMDFRRRRPEHPFIDVAFRDFVADPLPAVRQIYDFAGARYTAETAAAVGEWHRQHPRHSEGKFEYRLEDFGLTEAEVARAFAPYLEEYSVYL